MSEHVLPVGRGSGGRFVGEAWGTREREMTRSAGPNESVLAPSVRLPRDSSTRASRCLDSDASTRRASAELSRTDSLSIIAESRADGDEPVDLADPIASAVSSGVAMRERAR